MSKLVDLVREDFGINGSGRWWRSDIHSSLVVDADNDLFFFNSREIKGGVREYLIKIRGLSGKAVDDALRNQTAGMPSVSKMSGLQTRFDKLVDLFHFSGMLEKDYWYRNKINDGTINRYRLGYYDGWSLIPLYYNGLFMNFQCRRDKPSKQMRLWYKDTDFIPILFNNEILQFVDTVYITEGMVDCLLLNQLGFPSVCSTNGSMSWNPGWIKYFTGVKNIFYIADNDKAGIASAILTSNSLGGSRVKILRFRDKAQKYGAKDFFVDGGSVDEFRYLLSNNTVLGMEKELI